MRKWTLATATVLGMVSLAGSSYAADAIELDYGPLQKDWEANAVLSGDVFTQDGTEVGEVADLVIGPAGLVQSVIVETGGPTGNGHDYYQIAWSEASFDPNYHSVTVEKDLETIQDLNRKENVKAFTEQDQMLADTVIGMNARFENGEPAAEVQDLLLGEAESVTAMVVETNDIGGEIRAVPFEMKWIDMKNRIVSLPYSEQMFEDQDIFEYDVIG